MFSFFGQCEAMFHNILFLRGIFLFFFFLRYRFYLDVKCIIKHNIIMFAWPFYPTVHFHSMQLIWVIADLLHISTNYILMYSLLHISVPSVAFYIPSTPIFFSFFLFVSLFAFSESGQIKFHPIF